MTTAMDEPLLDHRCPGLVSGYRAGIGPASGGCGVRALHGVTALGVRLDDPCGIRRMDDVIRIAVEDDRPRAQERTFILPASNLRHSDKPTNR